jgi:hypothetical protein
LGGNSDKNIQMDQVHGKYLKFPPMNDRFCGVK